jgi:hypothetical protein
MKMQTTFLERTHKASNPPKFQAGDTAVALVSVEFTDGTKHEVSQEFVVTEETCAYYNVCHVNYDKK